MDAFEYQILQERFSAKLKSKTGYTSNRETAYNEGVLACKSILKEVYGRWNKEVQNG